MHGYNARYEKNFEYKCIHGKQFDPDHPQLAGQNAKVREVIAGYYGAGG
jgi:hypothetical protein